MSDGTFLLEPPEVAVDGPPSGKKVAISFGDRPQFVTGRRAWIKYRELGVTEATGGAMRAQVINATPGENQPTGWHLHRCDMQFLYVMTGAIHIAFSPDHVIRLEAGDAAMIPGGTLHQELGGAEGVQILEITLPAEIGTENHPSPWGDAEIDFTKFLTAKQAEAEAVS